MRTAHRHLPLLVLLAAPLPAAPQAPAFSTTPLRVRVPAGASISLAPSSVPWSAARAPPYPSNDLFVSAGADVRRHAWRSLAAPGPLGFGVPALVNCVQAGLFNENSGDGLADLAYCSQNPVSPFNDGLFVFFGDAPLAPFFAPGGLASTLSSAHLLDTRRDVIVAGDSSPPLFQFTAVDLGGSGAAPTVAGSVAWNSSCCTPLGDDTLLPVRLSTAARGPAQVHDLVRSRSPGVDVLWNLGPDATLSLGDFQLVNVLLGPAPSGWQASGAAALDVNFDGIPDLVACLYSPFSGSPPPPQLVWVKNDGVAANLATNPRGDLGALLGISEARLCRPLDLDGTPALAVWDGPRGEIVVVTSDAAGRQLLAWRGSIGGRIPIDIRAGDVVGSPLADLVVAYAGAGGVDVFPDAGDQLPDLAWEKAPPTAAIRGRDLALEVAASDPDGQVEHVEWFRDGAAAAASTATAPPYAFTIPGQDLCGLPGPIGILVRATDDVGLYRELEASIPLVDGPPLLALPGEGGALSVPLAPGGTTIVLDVGVSGTCGATLDWTPPAGLLAAGATARREDGGSGARLIVDVPEASYPAILAQPSLAFPAEIRAASAGGSASASVSIDLDASGLVAVEQTSDRTALAPGDLALLTATVRSGVSVTLPAVLLDDRLDGLEPAGPMRVDGADAGAAVRTETGIGVMLDLPGGGRPVTIELPVRRTLAPAGASRVRAVAPASGASLSREARLGPSRPTLPGCGCGGEGGTSGLAVLFLALYVNAMRRVLARTRSTSSSTPMRRQA